jgi:V8-like Glu-specific endopeptidase
MARKSWKYSLGLAGAFAFAALTAPAWAQDAKITVPAQLPIEGAQPKPSDAKLPAPQALQLQQFNLGIDKPAMGQDLLNSLNTVMRSSDGTVKTVPLSNKARAAIVKARAPDILQAKPGKLVQVKDATSAPYNSVGTFFNGCTGIIVAKKFVLTAAYCVYDVQKNEWRPASELQFVPAVNGDANNLPFGVLNPKTAFLAEPFIKGERRAYWYALVELATDPSAQTGSWGMVSKTSEKVVNLTGYVLDAQPQFSMWEVGCNIMARKPTFYAYGCGLKKPLLVFGAPIWVNDKDAGGPAVVGVHLGAADEKSTVYGAEALSNEALNTIISWIESAGGTGGGGGGGGGTEEGGEEEEGAGGQEGEEGDEGQE